jgi:hypothetical protein
MPFLRSAYLPHSDQFLPARCETGRLGRHGVEPNVQLDGHGVEPNVLGYRDTLMC